MEGCVGIGFIWRQLSQSLAGGFGLTYGGGEEIEAGFGGLFAFPFQRAFSDSRASLI
jgi:hypothetical protein